MALFNANMVWFNNADEIAQFDRFVYLPSGYTFWTPGFYNTSVNAWFWRADQPIDPTMFCDYQAATNTVPPASVSYVPNRIYYDGSGCLKAGPSSVTRQLVLLGFDYNFLKANVPGPMPGPPCPI